LGFWARREKYIEAEVQLRDPPEPRRVEATVHEGAARTAGHAVAADHTLTGGFHGRHLSVHHYVRSCSGLLATELVRGASGGSYASPWLDWCD